MGNREGLPLVRRGEGGGAFLQREPFGLFRALPWKVGMDQSQASSGGLNAGQLVWRVAETGAKTRHTGPLPAQLAAARWVQLMACPVSGLESGFIFFRGLSGSW